MANISLYELDGVIDPNDKVIGTDGTTGADQGKTKNFSISGLGAYINALGVETVSTTDGTFINLTPNSPTIGDVIVTADLSATGTPSGTTFLRGDNTWATPVDTNTTYDLASSQNGSNVDIDLTASPLGGVDTVSLIAGTNVTLTDDGSNNITIDSSGGSGDATTYTFASGQPLAGEVNLTLSHIDEDGVTLLGTNTVKLVAGTNINIADNGSNQITITNTATGSVDGTGTTNYVPKWQDADTLTDSFLQATTDALTTTNVSVRWDETIDAQNLSVSVVATERFKVEETSVTVSNANLIAQQNISTLGYVKLGTTAELPASEYAGALRYRSDANNSYLEVCMQTGATTYVWHVVQTYTW